MTGLVAVGCGWGHVWLISEYGGDPVLAASGFAGLLGDALLLSLLVPRSPGGMKTHAATALLALAAAPAALLFEVLGMTLYVPDLWEAVVAVAIVAAPILGAAALLWLLFTAPLGSPEGRRVP